MDERSIPLHRKQHWFVAGRMLAAIALFFGGTGLAMSQSIKIDTASMPIGSMPSDFEFRKTGEGQAGRWEVVKDDTASTSRVIEQVSSDTTDYRFPLAIYTPLSARDVDVSIRFKAVSGKIDQAGGVVVRLTTPDDYYVARANALEDNVRFYRVVKGRREQLAGADLKVSAHVWHTLGLKAQGDSFTISFDGKTLFAATDRTMASAGKVALWTKADSITRFDQIEIKPLD